MKKLLLIPVIAIMLLSSFSCSKVPAGNVGVKVFLLGGSKGVDTQELSPGRYWIGFNEDLFIFPTFTQTDTWAAEQAITFQTSEGLAVTADVGISFAIEPQKVSLVFQKYRKGLEEISDLYLRQMVKDAFITIGGGKPIESVYGSGKAELIAEVEDKVRAQVAPIGIVVERVYWSGQPRLPDSVSASINAKIAATQKAQQRENEIQQAKAEAQKVIEDANGKSQATLINAKAEAEAIRLKSDALKQNPELVQLTLAERWDGKLPTVTGGTTPFIDLRTK
jgi:regulator of protease activity HflC (stomatin/prohibitin superfamily)